MSDLTIEARCDALEECYEFLLAYAAQGLTTDAGSNTGTQVREFLRKAARSLNGLAEAYGAAFQPDGAEKPFLSVLARDAGDSLAAIELILAQPVISSQLIDNLNANIHLRALLTDLFLIDETLKLQKQNAARSSETVTSS